MRFYPLIDAYRCINNGNTVEKYYRIETSNDPRKLAAVPSRFYDACGGRDHPSVLWFTVHHQGAATPLSNGCLMLRLPLKANAKSYILMRGIRQHDYEISNWAHLLLNEVD